jgi:hypothetical protein
MHLSTEQAQAILTPFVCTHVRPLESDADKQQVQQALLCLTQQSDYQTLGVCAESLAEGLQALQTYLQALGHPITVNTSHLPAIAGGVYLKFNTQRQSLHCDSYTGEYRGVLVTCQSNQPNAVGGTYGHLPLDLFNL